MSGYPEPSERIINILKNLYKSGPFKAIYDGDPDVIPVSKLPALCVVLQNDRNSSGASGFDDVDSTIQIRVIFNKQADWGPDNHKVDLTDRKIRRIVEERDGTTGKYLDSSIKGALREHFDLGGDATLQTEMEFNLGTGVRPNDVVTREGVLTINVQYTVQRW